VTDPKMKCHATHCERSVTKFGDLTCLAHWQLLPRQLRQLLIKEQRARNSKEKMSRVVAAASACLLYLESLKIQLPPETP